ncbi:hypothetical protein [Curtobacterium sp. RRHDQ10]|uniref:hypothetical protein n=1 Tax=Curtobacterium phyllosphaerae TaxID=3413379 RepID=UPI003BF34B2E
MNISPILTPLAVALVTAGTVTASATGAFAATPAPTAAASSSPAHRTHLGKDATLQQIQAAAASATASRITKLNAAITKVDADKTLTAGDRSSVSSNLQGDLTGMQHLQSTIAADTTTEAARSDFRTIFRQYRVIAVTLPQERIVREADRTTATTVPHLQATAQKLADRIGKHQAKDTASAKSALADLQQQITSLQSGAQGLDTAALAVAPAQFDQAHSAMAAVRTKARALRTADEAARKDVHDIRQALHG